MKVGQGYRQGRAMASPRLVLPQAAGQEHELSAGRDGKVCKQLLQHRDFV